MSKVVLHIGLITFLALALASPVFAQFQLGPKCDPSLPPNSTTGQPCNISAFITWIKRIINILFTIAIPIGTIFIVWGGFVIMTAAGNESRVKKGKDIIIAAVIGLAITFGAWLIITALNAFLKTDFQFR